MIGVYKITNIHNGKCYIGSSENVEERLFFHKASISKGNYALLKDDKELGIESFEFETIKELKNQTELESWENYFIGIYNSLEDGYNSILSRRRPNLNFKKYSIENEQIITPFELAVSLKLDKREFEEICNNDSLPHIKISDNDKRFLLSEVLTYLKNNSNVSAADRFNEE